MSSSFRRYDYSSLPAGVGKTVQVLFNQVLWARREVKVFRELYMHSQDRTDALNHIAGDFFGIIEDSIRTALLARIGRLFDPSTMYKRTNIGVSLLIKQLRDSSHEVCATAIQDFLDDNKDKIADVRRLRNRTSGHLDAETAFGTETLQLFIGDLEGVIRILQRCVEIFDETFQFFDIKGQWSNADSATMTLGLRSRLSRAVDDMAPLLRDSLIAR